MNWVKYVRVLWDRSLAGVSVAGGAVLLILGWVGVHDKLYVAEQIPYIVSGGLGGLFLLGVGATLWISADLRDEWRKLDAIQRERSGGDQAVDAAETAVDLGGQVTPNGTRRADEVVEHTGAPRRLRPLEASGNPS